MSPSDRGVNSITKLAERVYKGDSIVGLSMDYAASLVRKCTAIHSEAVSRHVRHPYLTHGFCPKPSLEHNTQKTAKSKWETSSCRLLSGDFSPQRTFGSVWR